uniref:Small ribosomal subunit protein uS11c n=1 Tax=Prasinococcus sp. CCMP1194 TaxID=110672 RepID=A0A088CI79_9VIRI|nr:ribosomal protein S11 [Prasinococcus sp. CCMP1194]|eukprot:scaffold8096_cov1613-Prasinococcus_capsulatus_cf.AAC.14
MPRLQTKKQNAKRIKRKIAQGVVHIRTTMNNVIVTITDKKGNVLVWSSAGLCGFKGARKGTPFAAQSAVQDAVARAEEFGIQSVEVILNGSGSGRESALRAFLPLKTKVSLIRDITPVPHNGCRPPKKRRV